MKIATSPLKRSPLRTLRAESEQQGSDASSVGDTEMKTYCQTPRPTLEGSPRKSPRRSKTKRHSSSLREGTFTPLYSSFRVPRQKRESAGNQEVKSGLWDADEQRAFLHGIICFGWGQWKEIGTLVTTRTNIQIKSYGQKMAAKQEQGEDIFAILKEPSPVPKALPEEIGDVLGAAQNLFAFKAPLTSEKKKKKEPRK